MKQKINSLLGGGQWESDELLSNQSFVTIFVTLILTFPSDIFFLSNCNVSSQFLKKMYSSNKNYFKKLKNIHQRSFQAYLKKTSRKFKIHQSNLFLNRSYILYLERSWKSKFIIVSVITANTKCPGDAVWEEGAPHRFWQHNMLHLKHVSIKCFLFQVFCRIYSYMLLK